MTNRIKPLKFDFLAPEIERLTGLSHEFVLFIYNLLLKVQNKQLGRPHAIDLFDQLILSLFKLRYNLPDRTLEGLFQADHVTINRAINRIIAKLSAFPLQLARLIPDEYYVVDSTTLRIAKGKIVSDYTGYKHYHGVKFQLVINQDNVIVDVVGPFHAAVHDKKIFIMSYLTTVHKLIAGISLPKISFQNKVLSI